MNIPSDQSWTSKELGQSILCRITGATFGCLFVIGTYSLSRSLDLTILLFIVVATPLYFGTGFYVRHRIRLSKNNKREVPVRLALSWVFVRGFCIWTIPALFLIYVFLQL